MTDQYLTVATLLGISIDDLTAREVEVLEQMAPWPVEHRSSPRAVHLRQGHREGVGGDEVRESGQDPGAVRPEGIESARSPFMPPRSTFGRRDTISEACASARRQASGAA